MAATWKSTATLRGSDVLAEIRMNTSDHLHIR
jgi:hypothetical protein